MKDRIQKIASGVQNKHIIASALAIALAIIFGLLLYTFRGAIFVSDSEPNVSGEQIDSTPAQAVYRHPLTGVRVEKPMVDLPQVFGLMIDHSADAWPQIGIDKAFYVIEAPVESGISRLLAFFHEGQSIEKIGPIRSARPYFVRWNNGLDALFGHVGGSNQALKLIASNGTFDLNQFSNGRSYWRDNTRPAPHNVYTSTRRLKEALKRKQTADDSTSNPSYESWVFKDGKASGETVDVTIDFSTATYRVKWRYDNNKNRYQRFQSGLPFTTEKGNDIWADNIAVVITPMRVIDNVGRREIKTIGEGDAILFKNGEEIAATWKKTSEHDRLRFYNEDGSEELVLNSGTTWVEVVNSAQKVISSNELK